LGRGVGKGGWGRGRERQEQVRGEWTDWRKHQVSARLGLGRWRGRQGEGARVEGIRAMATAQTTRQRYIGSKYSQKQTVHTSGGGGTPVTGPQRSGRGGGMDGDRACTRGLQHALAHGRRRGTRLPAGSSLPGVLLVPSRRSGGGPSGHTCSNHRCRCSGALGTYNLGGRSAPWALPAGVSTSTYCSSCRHSSRLSLHAHRDLHGRGCSSSSSSSSSSRSSSSSSS
jgi:hypothetical protein